MTATPRSWLAEFLALAAIWGASFLFMQQATAAFGALPTAALRVSVASLALLPLVLWRGQWPQLRGRMGAIFLVGIFNSALPFALYAWALQHITTGLSAILNATVPLFGALVAWLWLGDRLATSRILGLALGFLGVAALAMDKAGLRHGDLSSPENTSAIVACLLATLSYGVAANYTRRYLAGIAPLVTAAGSQLGASLALCIPAWLAWPQENAPAVAWLSVFAVGVLCTAAAYVLYFRLIAHAGAPRALAVTFVVPVFAMVYGTLLLNEKVTRWMLGCGLVVILGTALATGWQPRWRPRGEPPA